MATHSVAPTRDRGNQRRGPLRAVSGPEIEIGRHLPLIPEGEYDAVGTGRWWRQTLRGAHRLAVEFVVLVPDPERETGVDRVPLRRHYRHEVAPGKRILCGPNTDLARELRFVTGRRPGRNDRYSPGAFKQVCVRVRVRTVARDWHHRPLDPTSQYSVIDCILGHIAGGAT